MNNLFILGSPRSGTTFLASLLEKTVYGTPYETQYIIKYYEKLKEYGALDHFDNFQRLVADITQERAVAQWGHEFDVKKMFSEMSKPVKYVDMINYIYSSLANDTPHENWGDKTPHYILKLAKLIELFPKAKFIYIVRDGRDVALSLLEKPWGPNNICACAEEWLAANGKENQRLVSALEKRGQLMVVKYEALLSNYTDETQKILSFLGEPLDKHADFISLQQKSIMAGNFFKWKKKMSTRQIRDYDAVAGDALNMWDYEVVGGYQKGMSGTRRSVYRLHNFSIKLIHLFKMNVIDGFKIKFMNKQPFAE